jgi:signal transduction histidine kinase
MRFLLKNNLSVKLLRIVFSIYLVITLFITLIQITDEYQRKNYEILKSLQAAQQIFEGNLTEAVWTFDSKQLQAILTGMMKIPIVVGIQINNIEKPPDWNQPFPVRLGIIQNQAGQIINITKNGEQKNRQSYLKLISHRFVLKKDGLILGEMTLYSSNQIIFERVKFSLLSIVIGAIAKTFILSLLFLWAFNKYLTRQMDDFCCAMEKINPDLPENSYLKLKTYNISELNRIEEVYNQMLLRIIEAREALKLLNESLEQQVIQRTEELQIKNKKLEQLNQEKNDFLAIAAHDLKNPLSNVTGFSYLIQSGLKKSNNIEKLSHYAELITTSSHNMLEIVNNFLDVAKIEEDSKVYCTEIDLLPLVKSILQDYENYATSKNIRLILENKETDYLISSDQFKLSQILTNLISNAIKYSFPEKKVTISLNKQSDFVMLVIQDQGQGFSEADKEKLFAKFSRLSARPTANESSTGLGLYVVKHLADMLAIEIGCQSQRGEGTVFSLKIPVNIF